MIVDCQVCKEKYDKSVHLTCPTCKKRRDEDDENFYRRSSSTTYDNTSSYSNDDYISGSSCDSGSCGSSD